MGHFPLPSTSRQALLGDDIFRFFADGEALRASIADYGRERRENGAREITRHTVTNFRGEKQEVDIAISVSWTDHIPMFTAILRRIGNE